MRKSTNKNSTFINFICDFCGYDSSLDLRECPGCGRIRRKPKTSNKSGGEPVYAAKRNALHLEAATPFSAQLSTPVTFIFECQHCRYQTPTEIFECPECGRCKFSSFASVFAGANNPDAEPDQRGDKPPKKRNWFEALGSGFLILAFQVFFVGYEISGFSEGKIVYRDYKIGECWFGALCLAIAGIVLYVHGRRLEKKYKSTYGR